MGPKHGANYKVDKALARNTTHESLLTVVEAQRQGACNGRLRMHRWDWQGRTRFAGEISSSNMGSRKTHSSVLVDSEVAFGDDQSVIGVAGERKGQQLCRGPVTNLFEPLYRKSHNGVMGPRLVEWMYAGVGCTVLGSQGIVHSCRNDKMLRCVVGCADLGLNSTRKGQPWDHAGVCVSLSFT